MQRLLQATPSDAAPLPSWEKSGPAASNAQKLKWTYLATMLFSLIAFLFEGLTYNLIFLGRILPSSSVGKNAFVVPFMVLFDTVWALALWSYFQAHTRDPGVVPHRWHEFVNSVGECLPIVPARPAWQPGKATFCKKCLVPRPERAHHCVSCGVCVLRMDHHCPWINNCVGFANYKFFMLLGIYTELACLIALASSLPELTSCLMAMTSMESGFAWHPNELEPSDVWVFVISDVLVLIVGVLLSQMLAVHLPLATRNATSIEEFYDNMPNPFDQGSSTANIAQVFGAFGLDWFIPVSPWAPVTDGVSFPSPEEERLLTATGQSFPEIVNGKDEPVQETFWRLRYQVRPRAPPEDAAENGGPSSPYLVNFWGCGQSKSRRNLWQ